MDIGTVRCLCLITFGAALAYGIFAYASSALAHTAAYEIICELRLRLMEKLSRISPGYFNSTTQGAVKKIVSDDTDQIEVFLAHHLCEITSAAAAPAFTLLYLFLIPAAENYLDFLPVILLFFLVGSGLEAPWKI